MFNFQPTPRAKLGVKAQKYLKKGQPVDDQVIVDILVEAIRYCVYMIFSTFTFYLICQF